MYGQYREDLGDFARSQALKIRAMRRKEEKILKQKGLKKHKSAWKRKLTGLFANKDVHNSNKLA